MSKQKIHSHPRLSLNALAQYLGAGAVRREKILFDQKYPATFRIIWYQQAIAAICRYLVDPDRPAEILARAESRIRSMPSASANERQRLHDNADAIAAFAACRDDVVFDGLMAERGPQESSMLIEGVAINVRPEVILSGQYRAGAALGGIKLYLSKNDALDASGFGAIGALLHQFVERASELGAICNPRHCTVVDVFARRCEGAPRAITRKRREIEAACREIALRWDSI